MALSSETELRLVNSQHRQEKEKKILKKNTQENKIKMKAKISRKWEKMYCLYCVERNY